MSQLKIYRASAGSGKTFALTEEYLKLLFKNPDDYRHMLAVTFTNKATAEMRSRILDSLYRLSDDTIGDSEYLHILKNTFSLSEKQVKQKAAMILYYLLHDYSKFSVTTIDSFFQQIVRSFARETGLSSTFRLELQSDTLMMQAIENLILEMDRPQNAELKKWLVNFAETKIEEEKSWDITNDFFGKSRSKVKIFLKMESLHDFINETSYLELIDNPDKWIRKTDKQTQAAVLNVYHAGLNELLRDAKTLANEKSGDYFTASAILENLNALGIINDINLKLNELCHEKNLFLISVTNYLLNSIINNNDTPFLYEKTGVRYNHFMIDEFQDTSLLQYKNFIPLIKESLANNNFSMFVGDVKQAIYRWRNSDWNLLAETAEQNFQNYGIEETKLNVNWRSSENIVTFNNDFFSEAPKMLQSSFSDIVPDNLKSTDWFKNHEHKILNIYRDTYQQLSPLKKESKGYVNINFIEGNKTETEELIINKCINQIALLIDAGYKKSDICVLVRRNSESHLISQALMSGEFHPNKEIINVFGNESLLISSSEAVKIIVAQLKYLINPNDLVTETFIKSVLNKNIDKNVTDYDVASLLDNNKIAEWEKYKENLFNNAQLPLYELVESLINMLPIDFNNQNSYYLQTFLGTVHDFVNQENADLGFFLDYWDKKKDKLTISIPEDEDSIRVLTIHKAKGLEFKAVVMPFFAFEINKSHTSNYLWVKPKSEPFNYLNIVPVKEKKELKYSHFAQEYLTEIMHQYIDNLNIAYVAFTRAKETLSVFANISKHENKKIATVADLLFYFLLDKQLLTSHTEGEFFYQLGEIAITENENEKLKKRTETNLEFTTLKWNPLRDRMDFHLDSADYINDNKTSDILNYGKIMHRIFEKIITINDIDKALNELKHNGIISTSEQPILKNFILEKINNPVTKDWFNGKYKIKTEAQIIAQNNKRPDRVMFNNDEVIVIDYKFGSLKLPEHQKQIKDYIKLLKTMKYKNIKGYLWYMSLNEVLEIK
jgi:ATP-dependent exoDNAse (exonuclease V) beta subunit